MAFSELEKRTFTAAKLGEEWARLHEVWLQLEESKKNYLSALMNDLEKTLSEEKLSEAKLERLARGSQAFQDFIDRVCVAKGQELKAKVRYESAKEFFEAGRSLESTKRAEMQLL